MTRQCPNCGTYLEEGQRFCSVCGTNVPSAQTATAEPVVPVAPVQPEAQYQSYNQQSAQSQNTYAQQNTYSQQTNGFDNSYSQGSFEQSRGMDSSYNAGYPGGIPNFQAMQEPMTTKQWVGTIILTSCLGIISLILCLIWAFDSTTRIEKKNYCRAMLIVELIMIGVVLVIFLLTFIGTISCAGLIGSGISGYY